MPYISPYDRPKYEPALMDLAGELCAMPKGHLTYLVARLAVAWLRSRDATYATTSDAIAALEDAAHELRRRLLDPHEDQRREENGDIL